MENCNHVFEGRSDGVHCKLCGLHMNAKEYLAFLNQGKKEEKKPVKRTRKKVEE